MELIDSHAHLFLDEFKEDLPQVIEHAKNAGVIKICLPNIDSTTIVAMLDVCKKYPDFCYPMIGLHPTSVKENYRDELKVVSEQLMTVNKYIAIGEVGLDLYWDKSFFSQQVDALEYQIKLAIECKLPLVIHCREAFDEIYEVMLPYKDAGLKGIFHSFTGGKNEASRFLEFDGFKLGINGVVTFKNSGLSKVLPHIPLDRIVLETDAPYLAPVPFRGKRNESAYLLHIATKLAEIYGVSIGEIGTGTTKNAIEVFGN